MFVEGGWVPSTLLVPYQKQPPSIHRDLESTGQAPMRAEQRARRWRKKWLDGEEVAFVAVELTFRNRYETAT